MRKLILFLLAGCMALPTVAAKQKAKHVVMIAIDGWAAWCMPDAQNIPNIKSLMQHGCYTMKKRSVLPSSSAINWASNFMGVCTEMHGYTKWNSRTPEIPPVYVNERGICPTIYSLIHDQRPEAKTGIIYDWDGIGYVTDTMAISWHRFMVTQPEGACEPVTDAAIEYIKANKPLFFTLYLGGLDGAGHSIGWGTPAYYTYLSRIDVCLGRVIQALKDAGIYDDTIILMTSDHGGKGTGHGGSSLQEMLTPFIICGKNVRAGGEFQQVMMQFDVPATVAYILGLEMPQSWIGRPVKWVFK